MRLGDIGWLFHGRAEIALTSPAPEKFFNACRERKIHLKNIRVRDGGPICAEVQVLGLIRAKRAGICRGHGIKLLSRHGILRCFLRLQGRPVLFFGFAAALAFVFYMSGFIWKVEISPGGLNDRNIRAALEDIGLSSGTKKKEIDNEYLKNMMLLAEDRLGWLAVNVEGSTAKVSYSLKTMTPELIAKKDPCDITASKAGIIKAVNVYKGTAKVSVGETVLPGDTLVSGTVKIGNDYSEEIIYRAVHSRGEIYARTWYEIKGYSASLCREKIYSGKNRSLWYIKIGEKRINLSLGYGNRPVDCDIIIKEYDLGFGMLLCRENCSEYETSAAEFGPDEAERICGAIPEILLLSMDDGRISASSCSVEKLEDAFCAVFCGECVEQIGVTSEHITNDIGS